jgi:hypothetical protein
MSVIINIFAFIGSSIFNTALVLTSTVAVALICSAMFCMVSAATRRGTFDGSAGMGVWVGALVGFVWTIVGLANTSYITTLTSVIGLIATMALIAVIAWRYDENRTYRQRSISAPRRHRPF